MCGTVLLTPCCPGTVAGLTHTLGRGDCCREFTTSSPRVMLGCLGSDPAGTLFVCDCWSTMLCNHPAWCLEIQVNKMSSACLQKCGEVCKSPTFLERFIVSSWPWTFLSAPQETVLPLFWQTHVLGVVRWPMGLEHWAAEYIYPCGCLPAWEEWSTMCFSTCARAGCKSCWTFET